MSLAAAGALALALGCESPSEPFAVGAVRSPLVDGGAPSGREYSVFAIPDVGVAPAPRSYASLAFDAKAGVSVLMGGLGDFAHDSAETWTYDGRWTKRCDDLGSCGTQPSNRYMSSLAYVPDRGVTVAFGGVDASNVFLCDTWEWDTAKGTWTAAQDPSCDSSVPRARVGHATAGYGGKVALFGGLVQVGASLPSRSNELLSWDGHAWTPLCDDACVQRSPALPARRTHAALVYANLTKGDVLFVFGGSVQSSSGSAATNDLWEYDVAGSRWTELCTSVACKAALPAARTRPGAVYDPVRGRVVVHGGCDNACGVLVPDAWEFDPGGDRWSPIPPPIAPGLPPAKAAFGTTFDSKRRRIVEFGGTAITSYVGSTVEFFMRGGACTYGEQCHTGVCTASGVCAEPCTASGVTGPCVNGFACNAACDAKCQSCARVPGVCTAVTSGADDEPGAPELQCTNGNVCVPGPSDAAGECKFAAGQPCNLPAQCASGFCSSLAPHVCVDVTCNRPCQMPQGAACVPRERLAEPPDVGCAGLRCGDDGACLERCTTDDDCAPNHRCDTSDGKCRALKGPGAPCQSATECKLQYCVDGHCCGSACDGPCDQCGEDGRCTQRTDHTQPLPGHSACLGTGTCGGYCGGRTECVQPEETTPCGVAQCFDEDYVLDAAACNGNGECKARTTPRSCAPFACDAAKGDCFRDCTENSQCRRGAVCRIEPDGRGVCHDEGATCAGEYSIRNQAGEIEDCRGRRCKNDFCVYSDCSTDVPGDCAPGYACLDRRCIDVSRVPDAGDLADGGAWPGPADPDGGTAGPSDSSSCALSRQPVGRAGGTTGPVGAFVLAGVLFLRHRRGTRVKRRNVPGGARSDP